MFVEANLSKYIFFPSYFYICYKMLFVNKYFIRSSDKIDLCYFPIQNLEKIFLRRVSLVISPVILPRCNNA